MKIWKFIKKNNIAILFFLVLISLTVAFATYNQQLNIGGKVGLVPGGIISITNVSTVKLTNATADPKVTNNNTGVDFNLSFTTIQSETPTYEAVFDITITNETFDDFVFSMPDYRPTVSKVTADGPVMSEEYSAFIGWKISNAAIGDKIAAKSKKTFRVTFTFSNPEESYDVTYLIDADFVPNVSTDDEAKIMASVADSEIGDLRGSNQSAEFTVKVINTHSTDKNFVIKIKNTDKFVMVDPGKEYTVPANGEGNYKFSIAKADGIEYPFDSTMVDIVVESSDEICSAGSVEVLVDQTIIINDTTPPTVSDVIAEIGEEGCVNLSWDATDNVRVDSYTIYVFKNNNGTYTQTKKVDTQNANKTAVIDGLAEGTYYFVVAGIDNSGNTASSTDVTSATVDAGAASRSEDISLKWNFTVTINATNVDYNGASTVKRGETYTATFSSSSSTYKIPESLDSVTMGGEAYTNYTYADGVVTIPNVTGDIVIEAEGIWNFVICLVEGTEILLADGTYKKIEDVEYTDLLTVYDHLNGGITYVYPVWIEKAGGSIDVYQKITFEDGTHLKVAGQHCLFDSEKNMYVDVSNEEEFGIGSKVYKVKNGELIEVAVTNIEYIEETVNYYDVLSTTHYNVIANDLITTDKITQFTNVLYKWQDKAVYKEFRKREQEEQLDYNTVSLIPYDWFKGCNLNNTLSLIKAGEVDMFELGAFLLQRGKEHIKRNGEIHFIVTTAKDKVTDETIDNFLYKQGSTYVLPKIGAKYFVDTSTGKQYKEGDKFTVHNSTYFEVVY